MSQRRQTRESLNIQPFICLNCYGIESIERLHALQVSDVALCRSILARCYAQAAGTTSKEEFDKPFAEDLLVAFLEDAGGVADVHVLQPLYSKHKCLQQAGSLRQLAADSSLLTYHPRSDASKAKLSLTYFDALTAPCTLHTRRRGKAKTKKAKQVPQPRQPAKRQLRFDGPHFASGADVLLSLKSSFYRKHQAHDSNLCSGIAKQFAHLAPRQPHQKVSQTSRKTFENSSCKPQCAAFLPPKMETGVAPPLAISDSESLVCSFQKGPCAPKACGSAVPSLPVHLESEEVVWLPANNNDSGTNHSRICLAIFFLLLHADPLSRGLAILLCSGWHAQSLRLCRCLTWLCIAWFLRPWLSLSLASLLVPLAWWMPLYPPKSKGGKGHDSAQSIVRDLRAQGMGKLELRADTTDAFMAELSEPSDAEMDFLESAVGASSCAVAASSSRDVGSSPSNLQSTRLAFCLLFLFCINKR